MNDGFTIMIVKPVMDKPRFTHHFSFSHHGLLLNEIPIYWWWNAFPRKKNTFIEIGFRSQPNQQPILFQELQSQAIVVLGFTMEVQSQHDIPNWDPNWDGLYPIPSFPDEFTQWFDALVLHRPKSSKASCHCRRRPPEIHSWPGDFGRAWGASKLLVGPRKVSRIEALTWLMTMNRSLHCAGVAVDMTHIEASPLHVRSSWSFVDRTAQLNGSYPQATREFSLLAPPALLQYPINPINIGQALYYRPLSMPQKYAECP